MKKQIDWKLREARKAKQSRKDFGKLKPFTASLPDTLKCDGGYSGGPVNPSDLADYLFQEEISGPWLTCYMLRRFGWPNIGSDDYKQLMTWAITTAIPGLYLTVTPYLGGSNLHFGVCFENEVGRKMDSNKGRDMFFERNTAFVMRWWKRVGIKLYAWGVGLKEGDQDELVHTWSEARDKKREHTKYVFGLWRRTPKVRGKRDLPKNLIMAEWWLSQLIKKHHPKVRLPKMTRREKALAFHNPFRRKCEGAIWRTLLDLLRPTSVRDVEFNIFGRTEPPNGSYAKRLKPEVLPAAPRWPGAGNTPEYWYSEDGKKERKARARL